MLREDGGRKGDRNRGCIRYEMLSVVGEKELLLMYAYQRGCALPHMPLVLFQWCNWDWQLEGLNLVVKFWPSFLYYSRLIFWRFLVSVPLIDHLS
jgi:hypothetical protein